MMSEAAKAARRRYDRERYSAEKARKQRERFFENLAKEYAARDEEEARAAAEGKKIS